MTKTKFNPAAIIVTFYPDPSALLRLVAVLSTQVKKIYVVDNTPSGFCDPDFDFGHPNTNLIQLGENLGIAAAQNLGINKARDQTFSHVLLMDQDSKPTANMMEKLFDQLSKLQKEGIKVAAIGPCLVNSRNGKIRKFAVAQNGRYESCFREKKQFVLCDYLVASGSLIPLKVLDAVGEMEEELFIDCVDVEWGYRAALQEFICIGVPGARMEHTQGESQWNFLGFSMVKYAPFRHYYYIRNIFELAKRSYIKPAWKYRALIKFPFYAALLSIMMAPRMTNLKMVLKGTSHGLRRRLGRI